MTKLEELATSLVDNIETSQEFSVPAEYRDHAIKAVEQMVSDQLVPIAGVLCLLSDMAAIADGRHPEESRDMTAEEIRELAKNSLKILS